MQLLPSLSSRIFTVLLLATAYFLTAKLSLLMAENGYASPFWPPSGISIAALLLGGTGLFPGVFLGAFLASWQVDGDSLTALQVASGNSLEALLAFLLINRFIPRRYFLNYTRHVFTFFLIAVLSAAVGAGISGHAITDWQSDDAWRQWSQIWIVWWLGDLVGTLVFTPLILAVAQGYRCPERSWFERMLFVVGFAVIGLAVFGGWTAVHLDNAPFAFLPLPLLIAVGYRFSLIGSSLAVLFLTLVAINGTLAGHGPFVYSNVHQSLFLQQIFIGCISLCSLLLCAVINERERTREALLRLSSQLESRVADATRELRNKNLALKEQQSEQKQLIAELSTSERRYRALFENASEAVVLFSLERGTFVDANDHALKLFGRNREAFLALSVNDVSPIYQADGRASAALVRRYLALVQAGEKTCFEWRHLNASGQQISCEVRLAIFPSQGERLIRASITDITERLHAAERQRLVAKLFENTSEAVIITDRDQTILEVNEAFCEISGFSADEVLGCTPRRFSSGRHDQEYFREMWQSISETGRWQGEIWDRRKSGELYPKWLTISVVKDSNDQITHYLGQFTDISEFKAKEERLLNLATYDHLTGLHNRSAFLEHLAQSIREAKREHSEFSVFFIDLDKFKRVNDSLGHDVGDRLLCMAAERLQKHTRACDLVARLGGDEFTLLAKHMTFGLSEARLADKLIAALSEPYELGDHTIHLTTSIGISRYPADGVDGKELLKNADLAMYRAKDAGRNGYQYYTSEMKAQVQRQMNLETELRDALRSDQFVLHYQPQVDLHTEEIVGVEALIRWQHPRQGLLYPGAFIDVAEQSGLICDIGRWVLKQACAQARCWQQMGFHIPIAVNLSAQQFREPKELIKQVVEAVSDNSIPASLLELELTESMLLDNVEEAMSTLTALRGEGVSIAIDDFGTGYSSLSYLKQFAADKLKIDRSFVRDLEHDPDDAAIVCATIALGHSLHMKVIAEGVENDAQKAFLTKLGCDQIQGFYVSPALPVPELPPFVDQYSEVASTNKRDITLVID